MDNSGDSLGQVGEEEESMGGINGDGKKEKVDSFFKPGIFFFQSELKLKNFMIQILIAICLIGFLDDNDYC